MSGVENVFDLIDAIEENQAPDPVVAKNPKKDVCVIFGLLVSLDYPRVFALAILLLTVLADLWPNLKSSPIVQV